MVSAAAATAATEELFDPPVAASATPPNILRTKSILIAKRTDAMGGAKSTKISG